MSSIAQATAAMEYRVALEAACAQGLLDSVLTVLHQWRSDATLSGPSTDDFDGALSRAATSGVVAVVRTLFDQGARIKDRVGVLAVEVGAGTATLQLFLEHGWDINSVDSEGHAGIRYASVGDTARLRWFLANGADPNIVSRFGTTALGTVIATESAPRANLEVLLDSGADVNKSNALHTAASMGDIEAMRLLLSRGADINLLQNQNNPVQFELAKAHFYGPPLQRAVRNDKASSVDFLLQNGADPGVEDAIGRTPMDWAVAQGRDECRELLARAVGSAAHD